MIFLLIHYKNNLYSFSIAAVTNYHKFSGLKKNKFIILQFCG